MSKPVTYDRERIVRLLRDLNTIVVSLHRIGSLAPETPPDVIARIQDDFITDWRVTRKLAMARSCLSEAFDYDELEHLMDDVPYWECSAPEPPGGIPVRFPSPIVGRYSDDKIELAGNQSVLDALGSVLSSATSAIWLQLECPPESPEPYDRYLEWIELTPTEGPLNVERELDRLVMYGGKASIQALADEVKGLCARGETVGGRELHIEPGESRPFLASNSVAVVFVLRS